MDGSCTYIGHIITTLSELGVDMSGIATSEASVTFTVRRSGLSKRLRESLGKIATIEVYETIAKVTLVGENIATNGEILSQIFEVIGDRKIHSLIRNASLGNLTIFVNEPDARDILIDLHHHFFPKTK